MYYSPSFRQCLIHVPTSYASRWPENLGSGGPGGSSRRPGQSLDHVPEVAGPQRLPGGLHVREVVGEGLPKLEVELEPERKKLSSCVLKCLLVLALTFCPCSWRLAPSTSRSAGGRGKTWHGTREERSQGARQRATENEETLDDPDVTLLWTAFCTFCFCLIVISPVSLETFSSCSTLFRI